MKRFRFPIPLSIVLFLALTLAGTYYVRRGLLERAMETALAMDDEAMIRKLLDSWPYPANVRVKERLRDQLAGVNTSTLFGVRLLFEGSRETPLLWAVRRGDAELVAKCLDRGADPNAASSNGFWSPLGEAASANLVEIAKALLDHGADPNLAVQRRTPLHLCASFSRREIAQALIDHGADVRARDSEGNTPLHKAAENQMGAEEMMRLLLAAGADVNARNNLGKTPLHLAVLYCTGVDDLFAAGADVNAPDAGGRTPLHDAAAFRRAGYVEILLAKGAEVNARDKEGRTPLALGRTAEAFNDEKHAARQRIIELLVRAGGAE